MAYTVIRSFKGDPDMDAVMYTLFAIFAVYGAYSAVRELVIFLARLQGDEEGDSMGLCNGCKGCSGCKSEDTPDKADEVVEEDDHSGDDDFFRT